MSKITFNKLLEFISDIEYRPSACSVRFGCDCGCGGDSYTIEEWNEGESRADKAILELEKLGVIFNNENQI